MDNKPYRGGPKSANRDHYVRSAFATVVFLIVLGVCVGAGVWQLGRGSDKQTLNIQFTGGTLAEALLEPVGDADAAEHRFRRFELQGSYDAERQVLLDSMVSGGQTGYHVLTPFRTAKKTVLVNRGWVLADPDRQRLPDVSVSDEPRTIQTRLNKLPEPGLRLPEPEAIESGWPRRLLFPTREQIVANLGYEIADYQLLLDAQASDGYKRDWKAVEVGPEKHFGYALQWFAFGLLALVAYVMVNIRWSRQAKAGKS
jgi:cytochrome oxidase assembly protein ShyY1